MVDKNMSILVVDDFKTMRRIVSNLLIQLGFNNIDEAIDGQSALAKISEKEYKMIISDWNMEPMSGFELLQSIRSSDGNIRTVPFIMITAESKPENIIKAKQAGVNNYIVKPFNVDTLKNKLTAVLGEF
ncbi:MAG: response regulator [Rickettsiales bacterium]|nr:response regulator [Pseudomonadota bacterium]MDA0965501.1 response regulator [Pseudomonadota bacterium]MDG4542825.1 response regulator [Rickettsiales bacterium]MDG4544727.1 response regulator [Rickettsiales bacterium]MDG4546849.1 response regulator [Rickettsiales bacterium]